MPILTDRWNKINAWIRTNQSDLFIAALIFLVGLGSFGLGRLSAVWPRKEPLTIQEVATTTTAGEGTATVLGSTFPTQGKYVASKSGKVYHYPWCPGAARIKEENKIWFQTKQEAEGRGLRPAGNCPGL